MEKLLYKLKWGNLVVAAAAIATGLGLVIFFRNALPSQIPLFYSLPWGEDQLVSPWGLAWPVGLSAGICLLSNLLTKQLKGDPVLGVIVAGSGVMIGLIMILGLLRSVMLIL